MSFRIQSFKELGQKRELGLYDIVEFAENADTSLSLRYVRSDLRLPYRTNIQHRMAAPTLELRCKTPSLLYSSPLGRTFRWLVYLAHI